MTTPRSQRYYTEEGYHPNDGLGPGQWVPGRHGVLRFVAQPHLQGLPTQEGPKQIRELVACPTCHAKVTETCKTKSGHATYPHKSRMAPRQCACGRHVRAKSSRCPQCAREALRAAKRESQRRIRSAAREVAA